MRSDVHRQRRNDAILDLWAQGLTVVSIQRKLKLASRAIVTGVLFASRRDGDPRAAAGDQLRMARGETVPVAPRIRRVSARDEAKSAAHALFDPRRDAPPIYRDLTAMLMGDPPIGRSALDQREAAACSL